MEILRNSQRYRGKTEETTESDNKGKYKWCGTVRKDGRIVAKYRIYQKLKCEL